MRTEQAYIGWIRRFILANGKRHPRGMGASQVEWFLSALAVHQFSVATRRAFNATSMQPA